MGPHLCYEEWNGNDSDTPDQEDGVRLQDADKVIRDLVEAWHLRMTMQGLDIQMLHVSTSWRPHWKGGTQRLTGA